MARLTKSQRKQVAQKVTQQAANKAENENGNSLTFQQQNVYHMGASEMDALNRMQEQHPELVKEIINLRKDELSIQHEIVGLEKNEQDLKAKEMPYVRAYTFLGQFMAYSLGLGSLSGAAYFGYHNSIPLAIAFLTSSVGIAFAQFFHGNKQKQKSENK